MPEFQVSVEVLVSIEASDGDTAAQDVERYLEMSGPIVVTRGIDDLTITDVEQTSS